MFEKPTLLILGAGASLDYGFPLGKDLINNIIRDEDDILKEYEKSILEVSELSRGNVKETIRNNFKVIKDIFSDNNNANIDRAIRNDFISFLNQAPFKKDDIKEGGKNFILVPIKSHMRNELYLDFYNKYILALFFFQRLVEFDPVSIDFFLSLHTEFEYKDQNNNSTNIGKYAITHEILQCKQEFTFNRIMGYVICEGGRREKFSSWYRYLLNEILLGCQNGNQGEILKNNLSVITFNYDTSLELFLEKRLTNMNYFREESHNLTFIKKLRNNLTHVYGQIDFFNNNPNVMELSHGIKVIGEERCTKEDFKGIINDAKKIFILGYAFDASNNDAISMKEVFRLNENAMRADKGNLWLEKEVVVVNYKNSKIINSSIQRMIFDNANDTYLEPSANPPDEMGYQHSPNPDIIDLNNVKNLTIITKSIGEAIGSDFNFSN